MLHDTSDHHGHFRDREEMQKHAKKVLTWLIVIGFVTVLVIIWIVRGTFGAPLPVGH